MARFCVDACFLIGLFDEQDQYHRMALQQFEALFRSEALGHILVVPWPTLYECCGTRQAKNSRMSSTLSDYWDYLSNRQRLLLLDDMPYRDEPLSEQTKRPLRPLSLVDRVIRRMIEDERPLCDYLLTYNSGDFVDACRKYQISLINEHTSLESYGI